MTLDDADRIVSVRLKAKHYNSIADTAEHLGLDISAFCRMATLEWIRLHPRKAE